MHDFIGCLYEPEDVIELRTLPQARSTWHRAGDVKQIVDACLAANTAGENVYTSSSPLPSARAIISSEPSGFFTP